MLRKVIDRELLSGHGDRSGNYPEILIYDGIGVGNGSLICSIRGFHSADVIVMGGKTELWFESRLCLEIPEGIVAYSSRESLGTTRAASDRCAEQRVPGF